MQCPLDVQCCVACILVQVSGLSPSYGDSIRCSPLDSKWRVRSAQLQTLLVSEWQPFPASSPHCGPEFVTGVGGELTSPGYPEAYPPNIECTWMIRVGYEQKVLINLMKLDMGQSGRFRASKNLSSSLLAPYTFHASLCSCRKKHNPNLST